MLLDEMAGNKDETAAVGVGERSEPKPTAAAPAASTEVAAKPIRRQFTADYKRRIVADAERCDDAGGIGALLRREGLYSSHLSNWRRQYREGGLKALADDKRGRKRSERNPLEAKVRQLEKDKAKLEKKLRKAETLIDLQKKVAAILAEDDEATS